MRSGSSVAVSLSKVESCQTKGHTFHYNSPDQLSRLPALSRYTVVGPIAVEEPTVAKRLLSTPQNANQFLRMLVVVSADRQRQPREQQRQEATPDQLHCACVHACVSESACMQGEHEERQRGAAALMSVRVFVLEFMCVCVCVCVRVCV